MSRIAIIGAGISGLTVAQLLKKRHEVVVFEKEATPGGLFVAVELMEICSISVVDMCLIVNVRMYLIGFGVNLSAVKNLLELIEILSYLWKMGKRFLIQ